MESLSKKQIDDFIEKGFIKIEEAFSTEIADNCRAILWKESKCDPNDPSSWTQPVVRIGERGDEPFKNAVNTELLHHAFDQLAGKGNWQPKETLGTFPVRFPCKEAAKDTGWHVDASFPGEEINDYFEWRINIRSKGRALLMLFLFSDVFELDGPTIIRIGSHLEVAKILEPEGEKGLSFRELASKLENLKKCEEALATGKAGTVYLCHPFIVHAGQDIKGIVPRFMAQPALLTMADFDINGDIEKLCPVERAIVDGLNS
jgi:hypothetical protein